MCFPNLCSLILTVCSPHLTHLPPSLLPRPSNAPLYLRPPVCLGPTPLAPPLLHGLLHRRSDSRRDDRRRLNMGLCCRCGRIGASPLQGNVLNKL